MWAARQGAFMLALRPLGRPPLTQGLDGSTGTGSIGWDSQGLDCTRSIAIEELSGSRLARCAIRACASASRLQTRWIALLQGLYSLAPLALKDRERERG